MSGQTEFIKKLRGLLELAQAQGSQITIDEVKNYFSAEALTEEQTELVFDYLLTQKVVVKGYIKMEPINQNEFTAEEKAYLAEYEKDLSAIRDADSEEKRDLFQKAADGDEIAKKRLAEVYLKEVVEIVKQMYKPQIFLGDLIQEGNLGLVLGIELISDVENAHDVIVTQIRQSIQMLIEEQTELESRDKKMVEKVNMLDEAITELTEEMGRKISIDELAIFTGMEVEEIEDVMKLTGEETEEEEEE